MGENPARRIIVDYFGNGFAVRIAPAPPSDGTRCEAEFPERDDAALFAYHVRRARGWPIDDRTGAALLGEIQRQRADQLDAATQRHPSRRDVTTPTNRDATPAARDA